MHWLVTFILFRHLSEANLNDLASSKNGYSFFFLQNSHPYFTFKFDCASYLNCITYLPRLKKTCYHIMPNRTENERSVCYLGMYNCARV